MRLKYRGKLFEDEILDNIADCTLKHMKGDSACRSKLIRGDNLRVMKYLLTKGNLQGKIDLVYIDPPFATGNTFRMSDVKANAISSSQVDIVAYDDNLNGSDYIEFIRERLVLIRKLLSDHGSIYVHIDCKIGHYVKVIMDEVFGEDNFLNDITRIKCNPKNFRRHAYGNVKDIILFYSKSGRHIWNEPRVSFSESDIIRLFKKIDKNGRRYTTIPVHAPGETRNGPTGQPWREMKPPKGRHWRSDPRILDELDKQGRIEWSSQGVPRKIIYADEKQKEGMKLQDILEFKDPQYPEYPTEKNLNLLRLLVSTSSDEDSIVLDCFCGSGTTLKAAQDLGRAWIGIDQSDMAIKTTLGRMTHGQRTLQSMKQDFEYLVETD